MQPIFNPRSSLDNLLVRFMGPMGPTGPAWAPCWPHDPCYLGDYTCATNTDPTHVFHPTSALAKAKPLHQFKWVSKELANHESELWHCVHSDWERRELVIRKYGKKRPVMLSVKYSVDNTYTLLEKRRLNLDFLAHATCCSSLIAVCSSLARFYKM